MAKPSAAAVFGYAPRILIVEDDSSVCGLFARILSEDGYSVTAVGTAGEAIWAIRTAVFEGWRGT